LELTAISKTVAGFNPTEFVEKRDNDLNSLATRFGDDNRKWSEQVNESINERTELVLQILAGHDEHILQLQGNMRDVIVDTKSRLGTAQGELLFIMTESHEQNAVLLDGFEAVLPNSRIGALGNTDFYAFMISPIYKEEIGNGSRVAFLEPARRGVVPVTRTLIFMTSTLGVALLTVKMIKHKSSRREEKHVYLHQQ
jgi:hypothetical protein